MRVYHFVNAEFGLDDIRRRRLKIATLNDLNDPFELFGVHLGDEFRKALLQQTDRPVPAQQDCFVGCAHIADDGGLRSSR